MIRKVAQNGVVYNISVHYAPKDGNRIRDDRDEAKVYVLKLAAENADEEAEARLVRCSIETQNWMAAREFEPTDDDLKEFYADRIAERIGEFLVHRPGIEYIDLFVKFDQYPLWEQHLKARRRS